MTLQQLAQRFGIDLFVGDPSTTIAPVGLVGASPYAQACRRGVCVTSLDPECAYSACHEMAHLLVDRAEYDEDEVFWVQNGLAAMLDEPFRSRALTT